MESVFIEIDKKEFNNNHNVIIGCIYRPPKKSIAIFNETLKKLLEDLSRENKIVYLAGDFNINLLNANSHIPSSEFIEQMFSFSFFPSINKPTRITSTTATIIDNIFINTLSHSVCSGVMAVSVSDHCPVFCITPLKHNVQAEDRVQLKRIFNNRNREIFSHKLREIDWRQFLNIAECQPAFSAFYAAYTKCFNESFPITKIKIGYRNRKPWLTDNLKESIKVKNQLYRKFLKYRTEVHRQEYLKYKRILKNILRRAEREHYDNLFNQHKQNLRKSWAIIKEVIQKTSNKSNPKYSISINGVETSDLNMITNSFNSYFVNVGPSLARSIQPSTTDPLSYVENNSTSMYAMPVSQTEIENIIRDLRNSAPGADGVPPLIIKESPDIMITTLSHLINLSLSQGVFPDELKLAKVIPLFKSGDKLIINNYRPVSLLSVFSKVFEKCMASRLTDFIDTNNILYKYQFGFRKKHSTSMAINLLVDKITESLDNREVTVGVALDFRKAFDTIDFSILLNKLLKIGIRGVCYKWFESYINNRQQYVQLCNTDSSIMEVSCGVPQGSILGPILFLLYINDLPSSSKLLPIIFADDTNVFYSSKSLNDCVQFINSEMKGLAQWIRANRLSLNLDKTQSITFSRSRQRTATPVVIDNIPVKEVTSIKFLGVFIDNKLNWNMHIYYLKGKIAKSVGILACARKNLNDRTLITLYYAFIYPYITYCVDVWGHCSQHLFQSLFKLQKRAVRLITNSSRRSHTGPLFQSLELLNLKSIYILNIAIIMFKYHTRQLPPVMYELFIPNTSIHSINTRQQNRLHVPRMITSSSQKSIRFRGVHVWNQITQIINIDEISLGILKKRLKIMLLTDETVINLNITE